MGGWRERWMGPTHCRNAREVKKTRSRSQHAPSKEMEILSAVAASPESPASRVSELKRPRSAPPLPAPPRHQSYSLTYFAANFGSFSFGVSLSSPFQNARRGISHFSFCCCAPPRPSPPLPHWAALGRAASPDGFLAAFLGLSVCLFVYLSVRSPRVRWKSVRLRPPSPRPIGSNLARPGRTWRGVVQLKMAALCLCLAASIPSMDPSLADRTAHRSSGPLSAAGSVGRA